MSIQCSKLGPNGKLYIADNEEGIRMRNSMVFRVKSDAFVPAGGRPNTIDGTNWRQFLGADGKPTSPLIVEVRAAMCAHAPASI